MVVDGVNNVYVLSTYGAAICGQCRSASISIHWKLALGNCNSTVVLLTILCSDDIWITIHATVGRVSASAFIFQLICKHQKSLIRACLILHTP